MIESDVLVEAVEDYVRRSVLPLAQRIVALERRIAHLQLEKGERGEAGAAGRDGVDGKDGADGSPGRDGLSVTLDDVRPLLAEMVAAIPQPKDGIAGKDGRDGIDGMNAIVDYDAIAQEVAKFVAEEVIKIPPAKEGPPGRDGASVHPDTVRVMIGAEVKEALERMPKPRDGKDADPRDVERAASAEVARQVEAILPFIKGERGEPGLGFDDVSGILDDDGFALRFVRGDAVKDVRLPITLYGGVWKAGDYRQGACMTYGGSLWIARRDTSGVPGKSDDWQLAVKRGQDAK